MTETPAQTRGSAIQQLRSKQNTDSFWRRLPQRIRQGQIIPVISNSFRMDHIFRPLIQASDQPMACNNTVESMLAGMWAEALEYPLTDCSDINRVAQYNRTINGGQWGANDNYLDFIKRSLLYFAELSNPDLELIASLRSDLDRHTFTSIVRELDYPSFASGDADPLKILANLPLPIYITTSYHDFLERELMLAGKNPITQVCMWAGDPSMLRPEHRRLENVEFTLAKPLVYHLYGLEDYPSTMVLSEDDHLDFFKRIMLDLDAHHAIVPNFLKGIFNSASLVLLGYRLQEWDFRILFRSLIGTKTDGLREESLIIQLTPSQQFTINAASAQEYLQKYFSPHNFRLEWNDTDLFLKRVWEEWKK